MKKEEFIKNINFWNWKAYRDNYPDLNNKSQQFLLRHVLNHGIKENRNIIINKDMNSISKKTIEKNFDLLLPKDFYWKDYIYLQSDLKNMNESKAKCHYILHGNFEGRNYIINSNSNSNTIESIFNFVLNFFKSSINPKKKNIDDTKIISKKKFLSLRFNLFIKINNITEEKIKTNPPDIGMGKECDFLALGISNIL